MSGNLPDSVDYAGFTAVGGILAVSSATVPPPPTIVTIVEFY